MTKKQKKIEKHKDNKEQKEKKDKKKSKKKGDDLEEEIKDVFKDDKKMLKNKKKKD